MAGEMYSIHPLTATEPDGTVWELHRAIVGALRRRGCDATVQPFDTYCGPYILVGVDVQVGVKPYQLAAQEQGVVRLWVVGCEDSASDDVFARIYNEATCKVSQPFYQWGKGAGREAVRAALEVL